jgi:hypothetical protein
MAVKMMQREVTSTVVKFASVLVEDGKAIAIEGEQILVGNVEADKAQKILTKELGAGVTVLSVEADTQVYEMPVDEFIKLATIKEV